MSELRRGWCKVTIADVTEPFASVDPRKTPDQVFRYVDIGSIDNTSQTISEPKVIRGAEAPSRAKRVIRAGDVLFSTVRTYLKNVALVPAELDGELTSTGIAVLRSNAAVDPGYLFNWASSEEFISEVSVAQDGTMYPAVSDGDVAKAAILVPPLTEQRRIVAKIDSVSAKSRRARDHLDHIPRLVEKYKQAILATSFNESSFARWERGALGDFIAEGLVGLVRSKDQQSASDGTPYIRMNHFDIEGVWNDDNMSFVEVTTEELRRYELRDGDVLFNTRNSFELVGKVAVWTSDRPGHVYNNNLLRLRFVSRVHPQFAGYLMMSPSFRSYLQSVKSATTSVCAVYQRSLMQAPFAFPTLDEQQSLAKAISTAIGQVERLAIEASSARKLIDHLDQAVLAKAFRGELVPQDPADEPASVLLQRIRAERQSKLVKTSGAAPRF